MGFLFKNNDLPDLDELMRKWLDLLRNKRPKAKRASVNGDGGGDGGGSGGGNNNRDELGEDEPPGSGPTLPPLPLLFSLIGALILVVYLFFGFFTVDANERVVMFRLGNPIGVRGPGLKWHIPLVENYRIVNVSEVRRVEIGYRNETKNKNLRESLMLTQDLNIIDMQFVVQYALNDPELFLFENRFISEGAEDVVKQVSETAMREIVGRSNIDFVLYEGRESIADEARSLMQEILNHYKTGIEVQEVAVQNVQPPDQVQDAFEDAIKARQDRERKINEGEAYANNVLPLARGQASRITKDAEAYQESIIVRSEGDADRFLQLAREYEQAPGITRRRLYLETMEAVYSRASKVIIDDNAGDGNLLYLPLDKIMGAAAVPTLPSAGGGDGKKQDDTLDSLKDRLRDGVGRGLETLENRR